MMCENRFCVYESNGECKLDEISVNEFGMCAECIYPDISEEVLEKEKNKVLERYRDLDNL